MMNKFSKVLIIISALLLSVITVPSAMAYFYTYTNTEGTITVTLFDSGEIKEEIKEGIKRVTVEAEPDSEPVFIRVKYIAPAGANVTVVLDENNNLPEGWSTDGEYYYYANPIDGKGDNSDDDLIKNKTATTLDIKIERKSDDDEFNVVVLNEMTAALFKSGSEAPSADYKFEDVEKGGWWYADWTTIIEPNTIVKEGD